MRGLALSGVKCPLVYCVCNSCKRIAPEYSHWNRNHSLAPPWCRWLATVTMRRVKELAAADDTLGGRITMTGTQLAAVNEKQNTQLSSLVYKQSAALLNRCCQCLCGLITQSTCTHTNVCARAHTHTCTNRILHSKPPM